jgi:uncharacterized membrane protein YkvA (DUF1232 family)
MITSSVSNALGRNATHSQSVPKTPNVEERRVQDMLAEGGGVVASRVEADPSVEADSHSSSQAPPGGGASSSPERARTAAHETLERLRSAWDKRVKAWGKRNLEKLVEKKGRVSRSMDAVPRQMHLVANQTELVLELIDDFRAGTYRDVSWGSMALLVGGLLYTVSPADVIPDAIPVLGSLDDLMVLAIVTRSANRQLRAYCRFKGYAESEYFRDT